MATTVANLFDKLSGSKWNAGVTFERTNPVPLEKYSVFHTKADADNYALSSPVAYPGQLVAVVTDTAVTTYKINVDGTLSQIDAAIQPSDLPISAGVGIEFGENDGKTTINAKLKSGNGLTADGEGYLSVQQLDLDTVVDNTKAQSSAVPYTSAVWAAISANATSAQASSIAETIVENAISGKITGGGVGKTLTAIGYDSATSALSGSYADISITSAQITDLTTQLSSVSASTLEAANQHADSISTSLSGTLSNAWQYKLSAANSTNPVVLSSDISNLIAKGVTFGGVYGTSADVTALTNAIPGQVFVLTGTGYNGKEYICTKTDAADETSPGHPTIVEVGDEGTIADIASKMISAVYVGSTAQTIQNNTLSLGALAGKDDVALSDISSHFDGKVALSTAAEVSAAISGSISTSLSLGDLAHLDKVDSAHLCGWFVLSCGSATQDGNIAPSDLTD